MNTAIRQNEYSDMTAPVAVSSIFHLIIFIVAALGIPFIAKDAPVIITPVSVELVDISELTQTDVQAPPLPERPTFEDPITPEAKPTPPQMTEEAPPDLTVPEPPPKEPEKPVEIEPEPVLEVPKDLPKPKPKPKPKVKPKPPPPKAEDKSFESLLKNLAPDAPSVPQEKTAEDVISQLTGGQQAPLAEQLTVSELDAIRAQLEPCWNIPIGAKYAEDLAVRIQITLNRDASLQSARILDTGRYNRDTAFQAAADSAMRALRNPRCMPLRLPAEKFDQWKVITISFDPSSVI